MDKNNTPGDDRTIKRQSSNKSDDDMEHLIPTKIAKLSVESESEDIEQKSELQKIQERLSEAVDDVNIDLMETILKELQPDDVRRLQDVIISLTCQSLERRYLPLVKCLFNNIIILQSDGQFDIDLNIQLITCAIKSDFVEGIQYLYSKTLYLHVEHDNKVWSALLESVKYNSVNITKYLLTISDLNLNPDSDKTILMFAKLGKMLSILLSNDEIKNMINYKSESGYTALYHCIENTDNVAECLNCIKILTEAGAEFNKFNLNHSLRYVILKYGDKDTCVDIITLLIQHGADVNLVDRLDMKPLTCAIRSHGDKDTCRDIISVLIQHGADVNLVDELYRTPLTWAIYQHGDKDTCRGIISVLIQHGADVNQVTRYNTPLTCAIEQHGDKDTCRGIISVLIQHGADVNLVDGPGMTPLTCAIQYHGDKDTCRGIISVLIQHGADVNLVDGYNTPLTCAIRYHGDKDTCRGIVSVLIQHGADVNLVDGVFTPLTCAIYKHGDKDTCVDILLSLLIQHGADVNLVDELFTPLTCAIRYHGDKDTCNDFVKILIQHGADPTQGVNTKTPLMYAAQYAHYIDIVKLVLVDIVNVDRTNYQGLSACRHCFIKSEKDEYDDMTWVSTRDFKTTLAIFKLLVDSGANLIVNGPELLYDIMKFGKLNIFEYYIGLKPLVDSFTETTNRNIFHLLAQVKYEFTPEKFNWLFNYNIDINHKDSLTNPPLLIGAFLLNYKYLDLITKHSPTRDVNIQNNKGHTAIHSAVVGCLLSKSRLKQNGNSMDGSLSEQYKAFQECVKRLLDAGGNINSQDNNGNTALILAAKKNNKFIIQLLLELGSNINILETKYDTSALQYLDLDYGRHCLKIFLMRGGQKLLNLPGPDGNTLIQRALLFPTCFEPEKTVDVMRHLIAENCCLQHLKSVSAATNFYNDDVHLDDFDSKERNKLRQLLYRSGAPEEEIVSTVNFKMEDEQDGREEMFHSEDVQHGRGELFHSENREKFKFACFNLSLEGKCIRLIRQKLGLEIKEKVEQLQLPKPLVKKILLVDLLPKKYFIRYAMDDYYDDMRVDDGDGDDDDDDDDDDTGFLDSDSDFNGYDYQVYNLEGHGDDTTDMKNNVESRIMMDVTDDLMDVVIDRGGY